MNSNEQMRREFEKLAQGTGLELDWDGSDYEGYASAVAWKMYRAAHTAAAEKYRGVVEAGKEVIRHAQLGKPITAHGYFQSLYDLKKALAELERE